MKKPTSFFWIMLIIFIIAVTAWNVLSRLSTADPAVQQKYNQAAGELYRIKQSVISFYCKNGRFPDSLNELAPDWIASPPKDPWGNNYIITSLAWRTKGQGVDLMSLGGDGKKGGKSWHMDIIITVEIEDTRCAGETPDK
jgi:hypothetical protein